MLLHGSLTTAGRRPANEDTAATKRFRDGTVVAAVADGMGGHAAGDVASAIAVREFIDTFDRRRDRGVDTLECAIDSAARCVHEAATGRNSGMGTTLVAALVRPETIILGNVGDSRAVLVVNGELQTLSAAHSVVAEAVADGSMSELEALHSPYRNAVTRALGEGVVEPHVVTHDLPPRETAAVLIIGSDGLFNFVGDEEILGEVAQTNDPAELTHRLLLRALRNGSDDNVTAAVVVVPPAGRSRSRHVLVAAVSLIILASIAGGMWLTHAERKGERSKATGHRGQTNGRHVPASDRAGPTPGVEKVK